MMTNKLKVMLFSEQRPRHKISLDLER